MSITQYETSQLRRCQWTRVKRPKSPTTPRTQGKCGELLRLLALKGDLVELAGGNVEDEPTRRRVLGDKRAVFDAVQRLANILGKVGEGFRRPGRFDPGLVLDRALEVVVGESQHPAVGVMNQDDLLGSQQSLADGQGTNGVVGDHSTGVADDMRLALL